MAISKTITFDIGETEYEVPVTFRVIEIAESVFDVTADQIMGHELVNPARIKRTLVAKVITQWVTLPKGVRRSDLYEQVMTCSASQLAKYAGCIQGAIAFALSYIGDEELQILTRGEDLPEAQTDDDVVAAGGAKPKK